VRVGLHFSTNTFNKGKEEVDPDIAQDSTKVTRYMLRLSIFDKPIPFTTQIDLGYMQLERMLSMAGAAASAQAVFGGLRLDFDISRPVTWYIDAEGGMSIGGDLAGLLASVKTGLIFHLTDE